jgi:hypothetical protein
VDLPIRPASKANFPATTASLIALDIFIGFSA